MSKELTTNNDSPYLESFEVSFGEIQEEASKRLHVLQREYLGSIVGDSPIRLHSRASIRFFRIDEIKLYDHLGPDMTRGAIQETMHKIITSLSNLKERISFLIFGEDSHIQIYIGIQVSAATDVGKQEVLRSSLEGNYPGCQLHELDEDETASLRGKLRSYGRSSVLTGIPLVYRDGARQQYCSDALLRGMYGKRFAYLVVGEPMLRTEIEKMENVLVDEIRNFQHYIRNSVSNQTSKGESNALTKTITGGVFFAHTLALQTGASISVTGGVAWPVSFQVTAGVSGGLSTAFTGGAHVGVGLASTNAVSNGESLSISEDRLNRQAELYRNHLDVHLKRALQARHGQGMWMTTCYLLSEDYDSHRQMESLLLGGFSDDFGHLEAIRTTGFREHRGLSEVASDIALLGNLSEHSQNLHELFPYKFCTPLLSSELSVLFNLPGEDFPGFKVKKVPKFSVNPLYASQGSLTLGVVCDRDKPIERLPFGIPKDELSKHAFVGGITGSGKTNTIFTLLSSLEDTPFLVIEPAKNEYRELANGAGSFGALRVYSPGDLGDERRNLRMNPFEFLPGENIQAHIDGLKSVFNASFPLWGPLPYIMEVCLQKIYEEYDWDISHNCHNKYNIHNSINPALFPTLSSFNSCVEKYIEQSGYSREVKDNIKGSLQMRLNSLCVGSKGYMLNTRKSSPSINELLSSPAVIELKSIGDDDDKVFIMALLLIRIHRYLMWCNKDNAAFLNTKLKNLLVIEEAHRLFRKAIRADGVERADLRGKAVESFENIMAEIRAYGMGVVIVDQIPSKIADGAMKNTNLKISHRLTSMDDMEVIGNACCLSPNEITYLSALGVGSAIVHMAMMDKAANIAIPEAKSRFGQKKHLSQSAAVVSQVVSTTPPLRAANLVDTLYKKHRDGLVEVANKHLPALWCSSLARVQASYRICMRIIEKLLEENCDLHGLSDDINIEMTSAALLLKALCELIEGKFYLRDKRAEVALIQEWICTLTETQFQDDVYLREIQKRIRVIGKQLRMQNDLGFKYLENADKFDPFIPEAILFWRNHRHDQDWVNFDARPMDMAKLKTIFQPLVHINDFETESIKTFFLAVSILNNDKAS